MKINRVTYFATAAFLSVSSCSKEETEPNVYDWSEEKIYFKTSLADLGSTRAEDMTLEHLESFQVTCFSMGEINKDASGLITPYFENATFIRRQSASTTDTYESSPAEGPRNWPNKKGLLRFFAFNPSLEAMASDNSAITDADRNRYFKLINRSTEINSTPTIDYRLGTVRVNPDISRQIDFITAETSGERVKDFGGGVELAFRHQMCQVELKAWGRGASYDFEIAGVRIGNPVVEGTYVFFDESNPDQSSGWASAETTVKDKVEYLYRDSTEGNNAGTTKTGDKIFRINSNTHNSPDLAETLMGEGGCALVIPTENRKWEGLADPNIGAKPYVTDKMYFSILLRVADSATGEQIYPYPDDPYGMTVIYYAVDKSGTIKSRVYPGQTADTFFTDPTLRQPYAPANGETIRDFGWATVPVDADWHSGNRYVYTLDYSDGIGLHDPDDPEPGKPISGKATISWGVSVADWDYAVKNEDFDPDITIP